MPGIYIEYLDLGGFRVKMRDDKRYFALCYMAGFLIGILFANFVSKDYIAGMGILDDFFLEQYVQTDVDAIEFLWYAAYIRLFPAVLLFALGSTKLRKGTALVFILWTGFSSGMILVAAVMKLGVKGIILCLLSLTPHFICYAAGYLMLLWFLYAYPKVQWNLSKMVSFGLFMLTGLLLECYVNPVIMKMFMKTL